MTVGPERRQEIIETSEQSQMTTIETAYMTHLLYLSHGMHVRVMSLHTVPHGTMKTTPPA